MAIKKINLAASLEEEAKTQPATVTNTTQEKIQDPEAAARALPSPFKDQLRENLRHKKPFNFGLIPEFIIDDFMNTAAEMNMGKIEYLYHVLRIAGHDIPPYEMMDRRKL